MDLIATVNSKEQEAKARPATPSSPAHISVKTFSRASSTPRQTTTLITTNGNPLALAASKKPGTDVRRTPGNSTTRQSKEVKAQQQVLDQLRNQLTTHSRQNSMHDLSKLTSCESLQTMRNTHDIMTPDMRSLSGLMQKVHSQLQLLNSKLDLLAPLLVASQDKTSTAKSNVPAGLAPAATVPEHCGSNSHSSPAPPSVTKALLPRSARGSTPLSNLYSDNDASMTMVDSPTPNGASGVTTPRKRKRFMQLGITDVRPQKSLRLAKQLTSRIKARIAVDSETEGGAEEPRSGRATARRRQAVQKQSSSDSYTGHWANEGQASPSAVTTAPSAAPVALNTSSPANGLEKTPVHKDSQFTGEVAELQGRPLSDLAKRLSVFSDDNDLVDIEIAPSACSVSTMDNSPTYTDYAVMSSSVPRPSCTLSHGSFVSDCFPPCDGDDLLFPRSRIASAVPADTAEGDKNRDSPVYQRIQSHSEPSHTAAGTDVAAAPLAKERKASANSPDAVKENPASVNYTHVDRQSIMSGSSGNLYNVPGEFSGQAPTAVYALPDRTSKDTFSRMFMTLCHKAMETNSTSQSQVMEFIHNAQRLGFLASSPREDSDFSTFQQDSDSVIYDDGTSTSSYDNTSLQECPSPKRLKPASASPHQYDNSISSESIPAAFEEQCLERAGYISAAHLQRSRKHWQGVQSPCVPESRRRSATVSLASPRVGAGESVDSMSPMENTSSMPPDYRAWLQGQLVVAGKENERPTNSPSTISSTTPFKSHFKRRATAHGHLDWNVSPPSVYKGHRPRTFTTGARPSHRRV